MLISGIRQTKEYLKKNKRPNIEKELDAMAEERLAIINNIDEQIRELQEFLQKDRFLK